MFLFSGLCFLSAVSATAAELTNLAPGLSYLRIQLLAESAKALHDAMAGGDALVLDLRYVAPGEGSAEELQAALASRPAGAPLYILVSPATAIGLVPALNQATGKLVTLGVPGSRPTPKVIVKSDAATDRRAYDALGAGTSVESLISGKIDKERFDEATLVKEFKNGNAEAQPPPAPDPTAPKAPSVPESPPSLVDRVLQRAVHLHQALLALRR